MTSLQLHPRDFCQNYVFCRCSNTEYKMINENEYENLKGNELFVVPKDLYNNGGVSFVNNEPYYDMNLYIVNKMSNILIECVPSSMTCFLKKQYHDLVKKINWFRE